MKKRIILTALFLLLISNVFAYDFCSNGVVGSSLDIKDIEDQLDDNSEEWAWARGDDIEISVDLETDLDEDESYVVELIFIDDEENEIDLATDEDDLVENIDIDAEDSDTVTFYFTVADDVEIEDYEMYIKFYLEDSEDEECTEEDEDIEIQKIGICENGNVAEDILKISTIEDKLEDNENEWTWFQGNSIELDVKIRNYEISDEDFDIEILFLDEDGDEVDLVSDSSDLKESEEIAEDDSEIITFNFDIDEDAEKGDYCMYVIVTSDSNEDDCTSLTEDNCIEISIDEDSGMLIKSITGSATVEQGKSYQYEVQVMSMLGSSQDEVSVIAYNSQLGINEEIILEDFPSGSTKTVTFNIEYPETELTSAKIIFYVQYDYDENLDYYKGSSLDDGYNKQLTVTIKEKTVESTTTQTETESDNAQASANSLELPDSDSVGKTIMLGAGIVAVILVLIIILSGFMGRKTKRVYKR